MRVVLEARCMFAGPAAFSGERLFLRLQVFEIFCQLSVILPGSLLPGASSSMGLA